MAPAQGSIHQPRSHGENNKNGNTYPNILLFLHESGMRASGLPFWLSSQFRAAIRRAVIDS